MLLLADIVLSIPGGGKYVVLGGAVLTLVGAIAGILQFHPGLKRADQRALDGLSAAMLGIGGTAGLYVVFYSAAYESNRAFWPVAIGLAGLIAVLVLFVFTRKSPALVLAVGATKDNDKEKEGSDKQDDSDGGHENVDEGGEDHAPDDAPATPTGARISQPLDVPVPDDAALTPEQRSAAYGALGGAVAALVVAALLRRPK